MDIVQIGVSKGDQTDFMSLVHESMVEKCEKYVKKCGGPYTVLKNNQNKTPIQYLEESFRDLQQYSSKIGVVIDGSTTRGFTEPSTASLYAQHLGIKNAICFDVSEACNGWARAIETAYMMFQTNPNMEDKYIMITNNEQPPSTRAILPEDVNEYKAAASYYVGLTFSHVAACTILKKSNNHSWWFYHHSDPIYASHINIPLPVIAKGYAPKCNEYEITLNDQYGQFCMPRLHQQENKIQFVLSILAQQKQFYAKSNFICHTWTRKVYEDVFKNTDLQQLSLYFNETGNLGSASMPYILHDQYGSNLTKGQNFCFCGSAAGGSGTMVNFTHGIETENTVKIQKKPINIYWLYFTYGFKSVLGKMGCLKKNKVISQKDLQNKKSN